MFGKIFEQGHEDVAIPIALVDEDHTNFSKMVIERIIGEQSQRIDLKVMKRDGAERLLLKNDLDSVFVIKEGFQKKLLNGDEEELIDVWITESSIANGIFQEVLAGEIMRLSSSLMAADWVVQVFQQLKLIDAKNTGLLWDEAYQFTEEQWEPKPLMNVNRIMYEGDRVENRIDKKENSLFSPYIGLWTFFTMISMIGALDWIIREKSIIFPRLKATKRSLAVYVMIRLGATFFLYIIQSLLLFGILTFFIKGEWQLSLMVRMFAFTFEAFIFTLFLTTFFSKVNGYYFNSLLIIFLLSLIGGSFFPIKELYSSLFFDISWIFPQTLLTDPNIKNVFISGLFVIFFSYRIVRRFDKRR
jgi:ABC-2 type transport system permease protein